MRVRQHLALLSAVVVTGSLLSGPALAPPADAVAQVQAKPGHGGSGGNSGGRGRGDGGSQHGSGKHDKPGGRPHDGPGKRPPRDRTPPATPVLGDPGVGPGGSVSLPVIAESGSYVAVTTTTGALVASGTGVGGYSSIGWRTTNGVHSYNVTATDGAGNRSGTAQTTVAVDALPPRLRAVRTASGTASDTRSRVAFTTDAGSAYRVLVDGGQRASGVATGRRVVRLLDLPDGRHQVLVIVRDAVGNPRSTSRLVKVRIPALAVRAQRTSSPVDRTQTVRVRATPTARRAVVRLPDRDPVAVAMRRGSAVVKLDLRDGTYRGGTVVVHDSRGRVGRTDFPDLTVDTSPPVLDLEPDGATAADGGLRAEVATEDDVDVRWRLLDGDGDVAASGRVDTRSGAGVVTADPEQGRYELVVTATDAYDRATKVRTTVRIADDPWPTWLLVLLRGLLGLAVLGALAGLALLVRWSRRPGSPLRAAVVSGTRAFRDRLRTLVAPVPEGDAAATVAALFEPEVAAPRIPLPRQPGRSGGVLPSDDQVLHRTSVRVYETAEEREDGPVLGSRTAELVVARDRIALVDDRSGEVWSGRIAMLSHVRQDTTMVQPAGRADWIGLVYADRESTRLALDLVAAEQGQRQLTPVGTPGT